MNLRITVVLVAAALLAGGCKYRWSNRPHSPPRLERKAQRIAKDFAKGELNCRELTPTTLSTGDAGDAKWYTVEVVGCGETLTLQVTCAHGICTAEE